MRSILLAVPLALLATAVLLFCPAPAEGNFAIHGNYLTDTDACAGCHRAHVGTSNVGWTDREGRGGHQSLLLGPPTSRLYLFCYICHGSAAPGAATDVESGIFDSVSPGGPTESDGSLGDTLNGGGFSTVRGRGVTSVHTYNGTAGIAWGAKTSGPGNRIGMDCGSCHDPHGSSNYRSLKDYVNGHKVGGYRGNFREAVDPDPLPYVISVEQGYPYSGDRDPGRVLSRVPTHGFRLHRGYPGYKPNFTRARYAKGTNMKNRSEDSSRGLSGWCVACHENYMTPRSIARSRGRTIDPTPLTTKLRYAPSRGSTRVYVRSTAGFPSSGSIGIGDEVMTYSGKTSGGFTGVVRGAYGTPILTHGPGLEVRAGYDAEGGNWKVVRHRHPVNINATPFGGDRNLVLVPSRWQAWKMSIPYVDLPLENDPQRERGPMRGQGYEGGDHIGCLTCHRAHGTGARMAGFARAAMNGATSSSGHYLAPNPSVPSGVPPAKDSALLRANNRGVCERCHNK